MSARFRPRSLLAQRLRNQLLLPPLAASPEEVVRRLVAVQSQDYPGSAWAVGQRTRAGTRSAVDSALAEGRILRTHVLRPTWHLVAPQDIRWLLELTGPRVRQAIQVQRQRLGVGDDVLERSCAVIARSLEGGRHLTRPDLVAALADSGIILPGIGHLLVLQDAELRGLVCSGPPRGRQHTYALLAERVAAAPSPGRSAALTELADRYFTGHGPATLRDFMWWSGLRAADARAGLEGAAPGLVHQTHGSTSHWGPPGDDVGGPALSVHLLPNYDEYTVAYRDRSQLSRAAPDAVGTGPSSSGPLQYVVLHRGVMAGTWRVSERGRGSALTVRLDSQLPRSGQSALRAQVKRYARFVGGTVATTVTTD